MKRIIFVNKTKTQNVKSENSNSVKEIEQNKHSYIGRFSNQLDSEL